MTEQLQQAFDKVSVLSPVDQDAIAFILMEELRSEQRWQKLFDGSADKLDLLAEQARKEHLAGNTLPLNCENL